MSHEERQVWVDKARTADQEHKKKWPTFVFQPRRRPKGNVPASRKVTESDRSNVTPKVNRRTKNVPVEAVVEPQEMMYVELESPVSSMLVDSTPALSPASTSCGKSSPAACTLPELAVAPVSPVYENHVASYPGQVHEEEMLDDMPQTDLHHPSAPAEHPFYTPFIVYPLLSENAQRAQYRLEVIQSVYPTSESRFMPINSVTNDPWTSLPLFPQQPTAGCSSFPRSYGDDYYPRPETYSAETLMFDEFLNLPN